MFGLLRRKYKQWVYCSQLNEILNEEDSLVQEWQNNFQNTTSRTFSIGQGCFHPPYSKSMEAIELRQLWEELTQLHRESRKLEEIKNLVDRKEENLSPEQKKALRQLKRSLGWRPIKLRMTTDHYLEGQVADSLSQERAKVKEYEEWLKQITGDEIKFWVHLGAERDRIQNFISKYRRHSEGLKQQLERAIEKIDADDITYADIIVQLFPQFYETFSNQRTNNPRFKREMKSTFRELCDRELQNIGKHLDFFKRAQELADGIKKRLRQIKPS